MVTVILGLFFNRHYKPGFEVMVFSLLLPIFVYFLANNMISFCQISYYQFLFSYSWVYRDLSLGDFDTEEFSGYRDRLFFMGFYGWTLEIMIYSCVSCLRVWFFIWKFLNLFENC